MRHVLAAVPGEHGARSGLGQAVRPGLTELLDALHAEATERRLEHGFRQPLRLLDRGSDVKVTEQLMRDLRPLYRELKYVAKHGTSANRGQHPQCSAMFTVHEQITHHS